MGNLPKKEGAYPKRDIGITKLQMITDRLQKTTKSWTWTTKCTDGLQKITKVAVRLQSLLIPHFETTKVCDVHILRLQKFVVSTLWDYKSL